MVFEVRFFTVAPIGFALLILRVRTIPRFVSKYLFRLEAVDLSGGDEETSTRKSNRAAMEYWPSDQCGILVEVAILPLYIDVDPA